MQHSCLECARPHGERLRFAWDVLRCNAQCASCTYHALDNFDSPAGPAFSAAMAEAVAASSYHLLHKHSNATQSDEKDCGVTSTYSDLGTPTVEMPDVQAHPCFVSGQSSDDQFVQRTLPGLQ